jgi:hypothetical protein
MKVKTHLKAGQATNTQTQSNSSDVRVTQTNTIG